MHTGSRDRLHLSKLEDFRAWALVQGYRAEPTKGDYEVLRLRKGTEAPLLFWWHHGGEHVTTDARSETLVSAWLRSRRRA